MRLDPMRRLRAFLIGKLKALDHKMSPWLETRCRRCGCVIQPGDSEGLFYELCESCRTEAGFEN